MNKQKRKTEWFDDESFWIDMYPFMFPEKKFIDAVEQVENLLNLVKLQGLSVLDLCCGPGRFSIVLAQKGFKVTGVDRTGFLLEKAEDRAKSKGVEIEWIQEDMRDFKRPGTFDLIINMFTSFGYFDDKKEDIQTLENMFVSLKPGGVCVVDVMGKERLARIMTPTTSEVLPDGTMLVQRHEIFDDWTRIRNEWILIRSGKVRSCKFHHTIYSGQEMRDLMEKAGFMNIKLYGNLEGDEYGSDAIRLIAVGRKMFSKETENSDPG